MAYLTSFSKVVDTHEPSRDQAMNKQDILIFQAENGDISVEVHFSGETVWLSLNQMAELFERDKSVISRHLKKIFEEEELDYHSTVAKFATVQREGRHSVERKIEFYTESLMERNPCIGAHKQ